MRKFGAKLSKEELDSLLAAFPGLEGGKDGVRINIGRIYDMQYLNILDGMYKKINVSKARGGDEPTDEMGYHGKSKWYRDKVGKLTPMSADDFISVIYLKNKMHGIMVTIRSIDKDNNGYVTRVELDDILKMFYIDLKESDLTEILEQFSSLQNIILIDYKAF